MVTWSRGLEDFEKLGWLQVAKEKIGAFELYIFWLSLRLFI
jgi:hypothetical protein